MAENVRLVTGAVVLRFYDIAPIVGCFVCNPELPAPVVIVNKGLIATVFTDLPPAIV